MTVPKAKRTEYRSLHDMFSKEIAKGDSKDAPIIILGVSPSAPNSVGGVDTRIKYLSLSYPPIKYINFTVEAFNAVNDQVFDETGREKKSLKITGPIYRGDTSGNHWDEIFYVTETWKYFASNWKNVWYNQEITCIKITNVKITFMDGKISNFPISKESTKALNKPLESLFSKDSINDCPNNINPWGR